MFKVEENGVFRGTVSFLDAQLNAGAIHNTHVNAAAALAASKLDHHFEGSYAQESATACADENRVVHVARAAGDLKAFAAGSVVANIGAAVVDVDLFKNGATALTGPAQLTAAHAAYQIVDAVILAPSTYVADDVFEVVIDGTAGGGTLAKGVFAFASFDETYA